MADQGLPMGIAGLAAPVGCLQAGGAYALAVPAPLLDTVLAGLTREALSAKRKLVLVSDDPAASAQQLAAQGIEIGRAVQRGGVRFLGMSKDGAAQMRRVGAMQWLDELDHYAVPRGGIVAVAPAQALFDWSQKRRLAAMARLYQAWAQVQEVSLLWLLPIDSRGTHHLGLLLAAVPRLDGAASILSTGLDLVWETLRWRGLRKGHLPVYRLRQQDDGSLVTRQDDDALHAQWTQLIQNAKDRLIVYATEASVAGMRHLPTDWQILPSLHDVEQRALAAVAATCVLDLSDLQDFRGLAHSVHRLRSERGRGLQILIRERGLRLRHGQAQLLLALGANRILHADITPAELLASAPGEVREVFMRSVYADFESAFVGAMPTALGGYQTLPEFLARARGGLLRAGTAGLDCALLRFFLRPEVTPLDALKHMRTVRPGDLCTADDQSVYLFLFACWSDDIESAIDRIVRYPVEQLFEGQIRSVATDAILGELRDLEHRAATLLDSDYRPALARVEALDAAAPLPVLPKPAEESRRTGRRTRPTPLSLRAGAAS